jgi:uroporphyrinogen decarboxylase
MNTKLSEYFLNKEERVFLPVGIYGGLSESNYTVIEAATNADAQFAVSLRMHKFFDTPAMLTGMDLSVEAEAFGCEIRFYKDEVPTVIGRKVTSTEEILNLNVPKIGDARTSVYLDAAKRLSQIGKERGVPVLGGMIGPFSLAGRIFGVSEALELSLTDPEALTLLLEKITPFLIQYASAFKKVGTNGVIIAEPAAGLLSPRGLGKFSSPYVRQIIEATQNEDFTIVLHNCGAKLVHLNKILEAGAEIYHFGEPMDMPAALEQVERKVILGGNLDPSAVFASGDVDNVVYKTNELLEATSHFPNFFLSSGCEIPPNAKSEHIEICAQIVKSYQS